MSSSKAYRTAGLVALCLLVGVVFSGALGGAQVQAPIPPELIGPEDPLFKPLADQIVASTPKNRIPNVSAPEMCSWQPPWGGPPIPIPCSMLPLQAVKECGTTIADILIDSGAPKDPVAAARSLDDGPILIGAARSLDDGDFLLGRAPLPKGVYFVWLGHWGMLGVRTPPELLARSWFTFLGTVSPDGKLDIRAILYYPDEKFRTPEEWLKIIGSYTGLKDKGCDLTVRHLSVRVIRIGPPCPRPPCPPLQWDIFSVATIANIGQLDVKDPFTVRVLLNGRLIHEEEIAGLGAGASQPVVAVATVTQPGLYVVTVMVDPEDRIKERDETNNTAQRSVIVQ